MSLTFQNFGTWPIYDMIFFRYMICYGRLVHFCCPAFTVWPCERSVANRFYFFYVFLLSFSIISASLSNICTVAVVAWNHVYTHSPVCSIVRWSFGWTSSCLSVLWGFMAVFIPYLRNILAGSQQSQITLLHMGWLLILYSPVLTCFFLCVYCLFFLSWHWSCFTVENPLWIAAALQCIPNV